MLQYSYTNAYMLAKKKPKPAEHTEWQEYSKPEYKGKRKPKREKDKQQWESML